MRRGVLGNMSSFFPFLSGDLDTACERWTPPLPPDLVQSLLSIGHRFGLIAQCVHFSAICFVKSS